MNKNEGIKQRVSPPYDVISEKEKQRLHLCAHNIARITLGAKEGNYEAAASELQKWIKDGYLLKDKEPAFYLYRQYFKEEGRSIVRTGIMGGLRVEAYDTGNIIPHEETFPKIKEDRLNLLRSTQMHPESIFCIHNSIEAEMGSELGRTAEPLFDMEDDNGVRHTFSRIKDKTMVDRITSMLSEQKVLIADGHHRYETALKFSLENPGDDKKGYVLATLVASNDPGLIVRPTHRLYSLVDFSLDHLLHEVTKDFGVWELKNTSEMLVFMAKAKRPILGMMTKDGRTFVAELLHHYKENPLGNLDTYLCEELIYERILAKEGAEVKVEFDHDFASVEGKMKNGNWDLAVILSPPSLDLVWKLARSGKKMPKKSTYFWPKIWSGFVLYEMN